MIRIEPLEAPAGAPVVTPGAPDSTPAEPQQSHPMSTPGVPDGGSGQGPTALYQYSPPGDEVRTEDTSRESRCCWRRPLLCPCLSRTAHRFRTWAAGAGMWPSGRWVSGVLCPVLLLLQFWALGFCFLGEQVGPDGELFRLAVMFLCAEVAGWMFHKVADVPALVGMLVAGVAMRSAGYLVPTAYTLGVIAVLRKTALALIMLRAGLGLDPGMLRTVSLLVVGLAILPATVEVAAISVSAYLLLDLPWIWGALLGMVLAAVAPSVVMPCFMELRAQRLGVDRGIDTLVIAAASFDDVLAISIYGVIQGIIFTGGTSIGELVQHPLGLLFGILFGAAWGKALQIIPMKGASHLSMWRFALTLGGGLAVTFGSAALGYSEAGPVGCIATSFMAAVGWRKQGSVAAVDEVDRRIEVVWAVFEPIMFSLIGADIDMGILDGDLVGLAVACILIALVFRTLSTWLLLAVARWNWKERLFVALAWLPKADVQAALGPLALDAARKAHLVQEEGRASTVLLVAVLAIVITAPAGATIISVLSRRLLAHTPPPPPAAAANAHHLEGGSISAA